MRRLKRQSGFTLAETLLAILILMLVGIIVTSGIPAAQNAYNKVVLGANAQAMLSTAVTALRDELGTAWQVKSVDDQTIEYFNASTGAKSRIFLDAEGDYPSISVRDYIPLTAEEDQAPQSMEELIHGNASGTEIVKAGSAYHLVPDSSDSNRLYVTYESIALSETDASIIVVVEGLKVCKKTDNVEIASLGKDEDGKTIALEIRLLSQDAKTDS